MSVISVEQTKVSVRQNATIEQLTILATVFLPLTFITGFFGQNFSWLVARIVGPAAFVIYGIGGLVVPLALLTDGSDSAYVVGPVSPYWLQRFTAASCLTGV